MPDDVKKKQAIRLRLCNHPVTFDGNVVAMYDNGDFEVEFDGPVETQVFHVRAETLVVSLSTSTVWEVMS
jgi:hypothetical protein